MAHLISEGDSIFVVFNRPFKSNRKTFWYLRKAEEWMVLPFYKSCVNDILFSGIPLFIRINYIALRDTVSKARSKYQNTDSPEMMNLWWKASFLFT